MAARPGGVANVTFLTLPRLAERLASVELAAAGRRPVTAPVLGQAVRAVLAEDPGIFKNVAGHPSTEAALVTALRELAACTPDALKAVAATGPRAADVVRIARAVYDRLKSDWYDEHDLYTTAAARVRNGCSLDGPVTLRLLERIPPAVANLLRAIGERVPVTAEPPLVGDADADRPVIEAHARAGVTVDPPGEPTKKPARAVSASDPDEEVRVVVRTVVGWAEGGVPLARMALLYSAEDPYLRLLHEQLDAAGVRHNGHPLRSVGDLLYGRTVRAILALPDRRFRRTDVMGLLAASQLRDEHGLLPSRAWERVSRAAAVVSGDDWSTRLAAYADRLRKEAEEYGADGQEQVATSRRRDADRADDLAVFVAELQEALDALAGEGTWAGMIDRLRGILATRLGGEQHRLRWPDAERQAADRVEGILDRIAALDALGGLPPTVAVVRRTLDDELFSALLRDGHLGDGVFVGPLSAAVGLDVDKVVILGMAEGLMPARRLEDSLLPDRDRRVALGQLELRADRVHDDHRHLLLALAGGGEAVLTYARGDLRRQGDRHPSRWLLEAAGEAEEVASFTTSLRTAAVHNTAQELRLARILGHGRAGIEAEDVTLRRGVELVTARRSAAFTRFDGNLSGVGIPDPFTTGSTTATRLEAWAACPQAYFQRYLLRVSPIDEPGARFEIDALTRGTLYHEVLQRFVDEQIAAGATAPWSEPAADRLVEIGGEVWDSYASQGLTGHEAFSARDRTRLVDDLRDLALRDDGRPVAAEWAFDGVAYPLPNARTVHFRGKVDRIDAVGDGLRVTDYKTGRSLAYKGLSETEPDLGGTHLQLAIYAAAVEQEMGGVVDSRYWFSTGRGNFAEIGYTFTHEVRARVAATLGAITDGIAQASFPHHPSEKPTYNYVECWWCTPDGLSAAELRRSWERKRTDPLLATYVALADAD